MVRSAMIYLKTIYWCGRFQEGEGCAWLATIKTFGVIVAGVIAASELSTDDDN